MKTSNINTIKKSLALFGTTLLIVTFLASCGDTDGEISSQGEANIKVTDAAVDAENVNGVYLSVKEVQATANGNSRTIATFDSPKLFNIMAYQNGEVYALGSGDLKAGSYSDIRLIMSAEADSYVEMADQTTKELVIENATTTGYKISGAFTVAANQTTDLVADIDLRKAIVTNSEGAFMLRSNARLVEERVTGKITGTVSGTTEDRLVVYAYKKGTFDASEENAPAENETRYQNSVNSAVVAENGTYTLAFMEEGEYEFVVASYSNMDDDEDLEFEGSLESSVSVSGNVLDFVNIESNTNLVANIIIQ